MLAHTDDWGSNMIAGARGHVGRFVCLLISLGWAVCLSTPSNAAADGPVLTSKRDIVIEAENYAAHRSARHVWRSRASERQSVSLGCEGTAPWVGRAAWIEFGSIGVDTPSEVAVILRYSKNSSGTQPVYIYVNDETTPRGEYSPKGTLSWNLFRQSTEINLGDVGHLNKIRLQVKGQQYGTIEIDFLRIRIKQWSVPVPSPAPFTMHLEGERANRYTTGQRIADSNASGGARLCHIGCASDGRAPRGGVLYYKDIHVTQKGQLVTTFRYSKNSAPTTPVSVYIDGQLRASFMPTRTGCWTGGASCYTTTDVPLGSVKAGTHDLTLQVAGQPFGVLDLDAVTLSLH